MSQRFFGREQVLAEIVQGVLAAQPGSFSLVGSKLVGKSQILAYLAAEDGPLLGDDFSDQRPYPFQDANRVITLKLDCNWQEAQEDLLTYIAEQLQNHIRDVEQIELDWVQVDTQHARSRQIWQMTRQLNQLGYRLVLLMDNFDSVFKNQLIPLETVDELRPLTLELALVVATEQPLHDLDRDLAASPLFNVMTQLFVGLIEPEAARQWIRTYHPKFPTVAEMEDELLTVTGGHPFLLRRIGDILAEISQMLPPTQAPGLEHMPLIRLRLAEHGRLLFVTLWRKLQNPPLRVEEAAVQRLLQRLLATSLTMDQIGHEHFALLNWLINQAMVVYGAAGYQLFSPLFTEFLADRVTAPINTRSAIRSPIRSPKPIINAPASSFYEQLTKTEIALLQYFQSNSHIIISPQQLLQDIWKRPDASPRRVQEAIRRLRLQLEEAAPPVGVIENERGRGYRFVPAQVG